MQILHGSVRNVNITMKTLLRAIWLLTMIAITYVLVGCASVQAKLDNGVEQMPGQRIHVTTTVYKW
jgi:uncharacterized protein YceK